MDQYTQADLTQVGNWDGALKGVDTVFHLAGKAHALAELRQDHNEYFRVNTEGTRNLLEVAKRWGVRRFVFFSSVKAMSTDQLESKPPSDEDRPWEESDAIEPDTPYGRSKLAAEKLVLNGEYIPQPVVLRLCMVYGAGAKGNLQRMLVAVARNRFPPPPKVANRRSMVHVDDVVEAAARAAEHPAAPGKVFIVSDGRSYSTRDIFEWMCAALAKPVPHWGVPMFVFRACGLAGNLIGEARGRRFAFDSDALAKLLGSSWFSSAKIERVLGFTPHWDLQRALPEMVAELRMAGLQLSSPAGAS